MFAIEKATGSRTHPWLYSGIPSGLIEVIMKKLCVTLVVAIAAVAGYAQIQKEQPGVFNFTLVSQQFCT